MKAKFILTRLLSMFLLMPMATELDAASLIKTIKNGPDLEKLIDSLGDNQRVYIDVTFKASAATSKNQCHQGHFGPLDYADNMEFDIKPFADNNHLLMTIIPGAKTRFPYNAVSCSYNSSKPTEAFIRFRGYYVALHHLVPTAKLIEFRPIISSK